MLFICATISHGHQRKQGHRDAVTGSLSHNKQVAGTMQGWQSPVACLLARETQFLPECNIINQAVWGGERRGCGGWGVRKGDTPLNELLYHLHACVELIQGENVLLGEEPQPRALPKVLQGEQRRSWGGNASRIWGRETSHLHSYLG